MREYALITLNMIEYADIYPKKQSAEYARILNVSDSVYSIKSLYKLLTSYRDRHIQNTVKHLKWNVLQKEYLSAGAQPEIFQGRCGTEGCGTMAFRQAFRQKYKKRSARKHFGVFSPRHS